MYLMTTIEGARQLKDAYKNADWENREELGAVVAQKLGRAGGYSGPSVSGFLNGKRRFEFHVYLAFCEELGFDWQDVAEPVDSSDVLPSDSEDDDTEDFQDDDIPVDLPFLDIKPADRKYELDKIANALKVHGRAVVTGMPGVGKSVLALNYAQTHIQKYPGGLFWVDVPTEDGEADDIPLQLVDLAITQGVTIPRTIDVSKQLRYCARHWPRDPDPVLLILDNVSSVEALQSSLQWLHPERFKLLITTRPQLRIPKAERVDVPPLRGEAVLAVFKEVLSDNDPRLVDSERESLLKLCEEVLGGLPLALKIVATALADAPYLEVSVLNEQIRSARDLLQEQMLTDVDVAGMLETVKQGIIAAFEVSWQALSAESQRLAELMSLFAPSPIPWQLVLEATRDVPGLDNPATACAKLLQMSLIARPNNRQSYRMHRLLRGFFQTKAQMSQRNQELAQSQQRAILTLCQNLPEQYSLSEAEDFAAIEPHVKALTNSGVQKIELYQALERFYFGRGMFRGALQQIEQLIVLSEQESDPIQTADLHKQAGKRALLAGMQDAALTHIAQAHDMLNTQPSSRLLAQVLVLQAVLQRGAGQYEKAETTVEQALEICQDYFAPDSLEMAEAKLTQATTRFVRLLGQEPLPPKQDFQKLEILVQEVLQIRKQYAPQDGNALAEAMNLSAKIYEAKGERERALKLYWQAVKVTEAPHPDAASALNNLAKALEDVADEVRVIDLYNQAITIFRDAEVFASAGWCLHNLGMYHAAKGRLSEGITLLEEGYTLLAQENDQRAESCAHKLAQLRKCLEIE